MEEREIGKIIHYFEDIQTIVIRLEENLKVGDTIHIKGENSDFTQSVDLMKIADESVSEAKKWTDVGVRVNQTVMYNDKIYKVSN